jgi:hypothetical protein
MQTSETLSDLHCAIGNGFLRHYARRGRTEQCMKKHIFFDALTHSLRRFQLYLAWIDLQTSADIGNCERLALIEQKCLPASLRTSWTTRIIHEK